MLALQTYSRVQFYGTDYLGFDGLSVWEFLKQRVEIGEVTVAVLVIVFVANSDHRIATEHLQLINRHPSNRYEQRPFDFAGLISSFSLSKPSAASLAAEAAIICLR
jgi:hypothetical protein